MRLLSDSIGRKLVMAITGLLMVLFVVGHLAGNLSIVFGGANAINTYAEKLHQLGAVVWLTRIVMGLAVLVHLVISIQITLENSAANPVKYAVDRSLRATFASKNMIWTGLIIGVFIAYHLLHFTIRALPGTVVANDPTGRFDVFGMVTGAFGSYFTAAIYVAAMVALFLHLSHGIQSTFQSLGLNNEKSLPTFTGGGKWVSALFLVGYASIPALIIAGVIR